MKGMANATRREFMKKGGLLVATASVMQPIGLFAQGAATEEQKVKEISPAEDLMREHGVLSRVLLIYDDMIGRLNSGKEFPPEVLANSAGLIRRFVEDYHEKLEEDHLFPRFEKAGKLVDLVKILLQQHQAGRRLTDHIRSLAALSTMRNPEEKRRLVRYLRLFIRMYRPHKAREDTVLFPAFRSIVLPKEFDALGEAFEDKEERLFGKNGFERVVEEVASLEKKMRIYDLSQFTPKM
jgi:hemerythrin-like domain-containing protein